MPKRSLVLVVAWMLVALPAAAGVLHGRLEFARAAKRGAPDRLKAIKPDRALREAVVFLDRVPDAVERKLTHRGWFAPRPKPARVSQQQLRFNPRVLAVAAGSRVVFENLDGVYHNTFSVSASKRFDLGRYAPGNRDTLTFERPGVLNLHCDVHPAELGFLVVTPNHAFARPDSLGRFSLPKLVPGPYVLRVWHPRRGEIRREVEMPPRGDLSVEVKL